MKQIILFSLFTIGFTGALLSGSEDDLEAIENLRENLEPTLKNQTDNAFQKVVEALNATNDEVKNNVDQVVDAIQSRGYGYKKDYGNKYNNGGNQNGYGNSGYGNEYGSGYSRNDYGNGYDKRSYENGYSNGGNKNGYGNSGYGNEHVSEYGKGGYGNGYEKRGYGYGGYGYGGYGNGYGYGGYGNGYGRYGNGYGGYGNGYGGYGNGYGGYGNGYGGYGNGYGGYGNGYGGYGNGYGGYGNGYYPARPDNFTVVTLKFCDGLDDPNKTLKNATSEINNLKLSLTPFIHNGFKQKIVIVFLCNRTKNGGPRIRVCPLFEPFNLY